MMNEQKILLSICIPTYNRAELLQCSLLSLAPQVRELNGEVELIVSDNCSSDNTRDVVEWARQYGPIRYHRNNENLGACKNILILTNELARGEFCWVLGDDDLVRKGAVQKILLVLKTFLEIDYIFVSLAHIDYENLKKYPFPVSSLDLPDDLRPDNQIHEDSYIEKWEQLIDPRISGVFLGGIQVSVFRTAIWRQFSNNIIIGEMYSSLESTYPHVVIFAHTMIGKRAYYIGSPLVIVIDGVREWSDFIPMIVVVRLNEILDLYERLGVNSKQIQHCRKNLLKSSGQSLIKLLKDPKISGYEYVSLSKFFRRFWTYKELWMALFGALLLNKFSRKIWGFFSLKK